MFQLVGCLILGFIHSYECLSFNAEKGRETFVEFLTKAEEPVLFQHILRLVRLGSRNLRRT